MHRRWFAYVGLVFGFVLSVTMGHRLEAQTITPLCVSGCIPDYKVTVTPDGTNAGNKTLSTSGYTAVFTVKNTGALADTYSLTCSGNLLTTCTNISPSSVSLGSNATRTVTVTYSTGSVLGAGQVKLQARSPDTDFSDTGYYTLTVTGTYPQASPILTRRNKPDQLDRGLCVIAGAGEAAWQCGDLVVAHGMPGYRTLGKDRSLSLVYNSATAVAQPAVAVAVTKGASVMDPPGVTAELWVNSAASSTQAMKAKATYAPSGWVGSAAITRQVVLSFDASDPAAYPTGIYDYTMKVRFEYSPTARETTQTGKLIVVNRRNSELGRGWAVAGVERIYPVVSGPILWVAGDGSARIYSQLSTDVWVAPIGAYRDTLTRSGTPYVYTRTLRHGVKVLYDAAGLHTATTNRMTQTTNFTWASGKLMTISVPPAGTGGTYSIAYDGAGKLDRFTDPAGRVLDATVDGTGQLTTILDPDDGGAAKPRRDSLFYDPTSKLMIGRTNRQGYKTMYAYTGVHVSSATVPFGTTGNQTAITNYEAWDTKGWATGTTSTNVASVDTGAVFTKIKGPRVGVADDATFYVDAFAAPTKVVNALGETTRYVRGDTAVPELVTRVTYPTGRIANMTYNARGNLTYTEDLTNGLTYGGLSIGTPNQTATYRYDDADAPDSPSRITNVLGHYSEYSYNNLGLTDSTVDERKHVTKYVYGPIDQNRGLVVQVRDLSVTVWRNLPTAGTTVTTLVTTLEYDAKGNPIRSISPLGTTTTLINGPTGYPRYMYDAMNVMTEFRPDVLNRDSVRIDYTAQTAAPAIPGETPATCDSNVIDCSLISQLGITGLGASRTTRTFYGKVGLDSLIDAGGVKRFYTYDKRGALASDINESSQARVTAYDESGHAVSIKPRELTPATLFAYDVLGRDSLTLMPMRTNLPDENGPVTSLGDTVSHIYGALGLTVTDSSRTGRIWRWFNANGSLRKQVTQPAGMSTTDELEYAYDAAGARLSMRHNSDWVYYDYDPGTGDLATMRVRFSGESSDRTFMFAWDELGRRRTITYPTTPAMPVNFAYDANGTVRRIQLLHPNASSGNLLNATLVNSGVDRLGRTTQQSIICQSTNAGNVCGANWATKTTTNVYSIQGWLVRQTVNGTQDSTTYDLGGNLSWRRVGGSSATPEQFINFSNSNRLYQVNQGAWSRRFFFDTDGARLWEFDPAATSGSIHRTWYDALGRVTGDAQLVAGLNASANDYGPDVCKYNPLGQLARSCRGSWLMFDGHNVAGNLTNGTAMRWSFVHGPGLDDPLIGRLTRTGTQTTVYFWVTDGSGGQLAVALDGGLAGASLINDMESNDGVYAGGTANAQSFNASRFEGGPDQGPASKTGMSFFRNRLYDQSTGRWTQEDPIGVAGGINLYQFNGNNPVSYTDPFGLKAGCPPCNPWQGLKDALGIPNSVPLYAPAAPAAGRNMFYVSASVMVDNVITTGTLGAGGGVKSSVCITCPVPVGAGVAAGLQLREADAGEGGWGVSAGPVGVSNESIELQVGTPTGTPVQVTVDIPLPKSEKRPGGLAAPRDATLVAVPNAQ